MLFVHYLLLAYLIILVARMIFSWVPLAPGSEWAKVYHFCIRMTEPLLRPLRRVVPTVGAGGVGIDLSSTVLMFVLLLLLSWT